ncbi:MAG: protein kinase [Acidimicrobiaceae bacterium]|nr:protein kinase [Acidimicrobiaceae bacterium]
MDTLGEGAFGTVYGAVQPSVGREVAVKVVRADLADDPSYVRRFEGEARVVARLEHPHIVPLYDFWREPGGAYLVFRLLKGGSVEDARGQAWPLERVSQLIGEISGALAVAHLAGVVHRDVKPANLLFDEAGHTYLADFGIAVNDLGAEHSHTVRSAGTPLYASPEQIRDGRAGPRSGQYSLAVVAWSCWPGDLRSRGAGPPMWCATSLPAACPSSARCEVTFLLRSPRCCSGPRASIRRTAMATWPSFSSPGPKPCTERPPSGPATSSRPTTRPLRGRTSRRLGSMSSHWPTPTRVFERSTKATRHTSSVAAATSTTSPPRSLSTASLPSWGHLAPARARWCGPA